MLIEHMAGTQKTKSADQAIAQLASVISSTNAENPLFISNAYLGPSFTNSKFRPGKDKIYYALAVYGDEEKRAVARTLDEGWLGLGKYTAEFQHKIAAVIGQKY